MFVNINHKHTLDPRYIDYLANILKKELKARYENQVSNASNSLDIQKVLNTVKPVSNIKSDVLKNYRFKN